MALTAGEIEKLTKPGTYRADRGLYLQVKRNGARSWVLRFTLNGRPREMGLGPLRLVPLTEARRRAIIAQRQLLDGIDPIDARAVTVYRKTGVFTFAEAAERYIADHSPGWRNPKHRAQWSSTIETYANPVIGSKPVDAVTVDDVVAILKPLWTTKSETAGRLRGRVEKILGWAIAMGFRTDENVASRSVLEHLLPPLSRVQTIEHHKAMPYADVPAFWKQLAGLDSPSAAALRFCILTAARSGEVFGADWSEIDLDAATWTVPASRMKSKREHVVPLSAAALDVLQAMGPRSTGLIFPGAKAGKPLSAMAMTMVLRRLKVDAKVHGFRSSFSDWVSEETDTVSEVREMALAHTIKNKAEAAYRRGDLLQKRREVMDAWGAYVAGG
jgi:integrase